MNIQSIHPPHHRGEVHPVIFLAGPIQGTDDWQAEATAKLIALAEPGEKFIIASPRRPTITGMGDFDYDTFIEQLEWEHRYLYEAAGLGVTMFWCARQTKPIENRSYGQTTRLELGEAMTIHRFTGARVVVGVDEGFTGRTYIRYTLGKKHPQIPVVASLDEACAAAIGMIRIPWTHDVRTGLPFHAAGSR